MTKYSTPATNTPEQVLQALYHGIAQGAFGPAVAGHQHQQEDRQPEGEGHDDEHGRQQGGIIGLAGDQEAEDGAGTGGQCQAPDKGHHAHLLGVLVHAPFHHHPQVHADDDHEAGVEEDVPGEDGLEVVVGHGHDQAIGTTQVQHQDGETAHQQGDGQQAGQAGQRLVGRLAEHRADGGDIQRPGCGHDQEHREHMGDAPYDLVVHARDPVAAVLHVVGGSEGDGDDRTQKRQQAIVAGGAALDFTVMHHWFHCSPAYPLLVVRCPGSECRC
jgi:hypothetical protein